MTTIIWVSPLNTKLGTHWQRRFIKMGGGRIKIRRNCVCALLLICVRLFATPWTVAVQAPLSMGWHAAPKTIPQPWYCWRRGWSPWPPEPSLATLISASSSSSSSSNSSGRKLRKRGQRCPGYPLQPLLQTEKSLGYCKNKTEIQRQET